MRCDVIANIRTFVNCALGTYLVVLIMVALLFMFCSCVVVRLLPLSKQLGHCVLGMYDFVSLMF